MKANVGCWGGDMILSRLCSLLYFRCSSLFPSSSLLHTKALTASLRSAAVCCFSFPIYKVDVAGLQVARAHHVLEKQARVGLPTGLEPVASSLYSMSLGIRPLSMRLTWPSHFEGSGSYVVALPRLDKSRSAHLHKQFRVFFS